MYTIYMHIVCFQSSLKFKFLVTNLCLSNHTLFLEIWLLWILSVWNISDRLFRRTSCHTNEFIKSVPPQGIWKEVPALYYIQSKMVDPDSPWYNCFNTTCNQFMPYWVKADVCCINLLDKIKNGHSTCTRSLFNVLSYQRT